MRLLGHAVALGLGYALGRSDSRRRLRRQVRELGRHPAVRRLRERGWDLLGDQFLAARNLRNLAGRRSRRAAAAEALSDEAVRPLDRAGPSARPAPAPLTSAGP